MTENQVKRHLKSSPEYIPDKYCTLIRSANGPPYRVHELTYENFYGMEALQEEWGTNFSLDTKEMRVKWNDIKVFKVEKEHPRVFFYKTSYGDAEFQKVIAKNTRTKNFKNFP